MNRFVTELLHLMLYGLCSPACTGLNLKNAALWESARCWNKRLDEAAPCLESALAPESSLTPLLTRIKAHVREKDASGPPSLPSSPIGYEKASANAEAFSS